MGWWGNDREPVPVKQFRAWKKYSKCGAGHISEKGVDVCPKCGDAVHEIVAREIVLFTDYENLDPDWCTDHLGWEEKEAS